MSGDAYYQNVSLLLHCDGVMGGTTFTDNSPSPKTITVAGNAKIDTTQSKFGGSSAAFDGSGDYLTVTNNAGLQFGSGNFTLESWIWFVSASAAYGVIDKRSALAARGIALWVNNAVITFMAGDTNTSGWEVNLTASAVSINAWHHIAATREGTTYRLFVDGVKVGESTWAGTIADDASNILIGRQVSTSDFSGYMDDIRITKGVARYTADFTPPSAAFPNFAGQIAGTVLDDAGDPVARVVRAYRRDTGALVGNTTSDAGDGSYSMDFTTLDECTVICLDDAAGDDYNDLVLRVTPA